MGPLHISLNSTEHVFLTFWPFFQRCHENLFPNCKLPEKPRPWRINLLLELVYGGWLLVRSTTLKTFSKSKDLQYGTLSHTAQSPGQLHTTGFIHILCHIQIKQF
jgi:hypothetical protein